MLKEEKYKSKNIYFYEEKYKILSKKIVDKEYMIIDRLKDTKRNYVALIEINGERYILKEPRNEYRIPQRKLMSLFKNGEALTTLKNINKLSKDGMKDFILPRSVINERKLGMITYSAILMDYFSGVIDIKYNDKFIELVKKMHKNKTYHGDFNPGNFLVKNGEIKILDTQAKKMKLGFYRAHYDMITMKIDSYKEMEYPYEKDISYYIAIGMKKFKRLKFVEKIKQKKKKLRDRGWKI
ncbi:MAG: lipopolysaccharide core heptose(II) kinase RfaY [Fusobacteriaceae bacterium]